MLSIFKIRRIWAKNKFKILLVIFIIFVILYIIQYFNKLAAEGKIEGMFTAEIIKQTIETQKEYSIMSGISVKENEQIKNKQIVEQFVNYCNEKDIQNAYNLLTDDCKEARFSTVESFEKDYYNNIFTQKRMIDMQSWIVNKDLYTYKINILTDVLSTGDIQTGRAKDYYTIYVQNDKVKLNIDNFVCKETINKENLDNNIKVIITSKDCYIDYEIYKIQIENSTNENINLYNEQIQIYLEGNEGQKYSLLKDDINNQELIINSKTTEVINLKFNKLYNPERKIVKIVFENKLVENNEKIEINL